MSLISRMRKQYAVYWKRTNICDEHGVYEFEAPVEIKCRWVDRVREITNAKGEQQMSPSTVYVDREMFVGDRLMLGEEDSNTPDDPNDTDEAKEILAFETLPNLRNTENLYTAFLSIRISSG